MSPEEARLIRTPEEWLVAFAATVRARDLEGGRRLFAVEASGFGTVTVRYRGLDALVEEQWSQVWHRTRDFRFDHDPEAWSGAGLHGVAATWSSRAEGGIDRLRRGRATFVLRAGHDSALRAVHSHFSMAPGTDA